MPAPKTIAFRGREYPLPEIMKELRMMGDELAANAHLSAASALPADTDISEADKKLVREQIAGMSILPSEAMMIFWSAFAAKYLSDIAATLRRLSYITQKEALSTTIQILSLVPDPKEEPYFRKFLRDSTVCQGLPTIVADAFLKGISWKKTSHLVNHCTLIIHTLFWCDPSMGDDGKASVDERTRTALGPALESMLADPRIAALDRRRRIDIERLQGILGAIESMPGAYYLDSTREYLEGEIGMCSGDLCDEEAELACSKCKTVRYCGKECQSWHWKNGHKTRCFAPTF